MANGGAEHWDSVYGSKEPSDVSWYQLQAGTSLDLIRLAQPGRGSIVDVGAGESTLVEGLLGDGWSDVTVLDISAEALAVVRDRVSSISEVTFTIADILTWDPQRTFDVWHDRAVFHFLVDPEHRRAYAQTARASVAVGGALVIGTFAEDGPESCSGLPTARYSAESLAREFDGHFDLVHAVREEHITPWNSVQAFTWVVLRRQ